MKTKKFSGTIKTFDNKPLSSYTATKGDTTGQPMPASIPYNTSVELYTDYSEIQTKDLPEEKDIVKYLNQDRVGAQRAKAITELLASYGIEKPKFEDDKLAWLKGAFKSAKAAGRTDEEARQGAEMLTGLKWSDFEVSE